MNIFNIEDLFTEKNEREGMWFEPEFDGVKCGVKFLLIGINSDEAASEMNKFDELSEQIKSSDDNDSVKEEKLSVLDAERVAALTKEIRTTDDSTLMYNNQPVTKDNVKEVAKTLYLNSPDIKMACVDFVLKATNFMKIK